VKRGAYSGLQDIKKTRFYGSTFFYKKIIRPIYINQFGDQIEFFPTTNKMEIISIKFKVMSNVIESSQIKPNPWVQRAKSLPQL